MKDFIKKLFKSKQGVSAIEYAILLGIIGLAAYAGLMRIADKTNNQAQYIANNL